MYRAVPAAGSAERDLLAVSDLRRFPLKGPVSSSFGKKRPSWRSQSNGSGGLPQDGRIPVVADFAYVATWHRFIYVAFVIDFERGGSSAGRIVADRFRALCYQSRRSTTAHGFTPSLSRRYGSTSSVIHRTENSRGSERRMEEVHRLRAGRENGTPIVPRGPVLAYCGQVSRSSFKVLLALR